MERLASGGCPAYDARTGSFRFPPTRAGNNGVLSCRPPMSRDGLPLIRAVTADAGGTLLEPSPSVGVVYAQTARAAGFGSFLPNELDVRFQRAWAARGAFDYSRSS